MARVDVVCEIEADGSVKVEVEASDRALCNAEASALRERLSGKTPGSRAVAPRVDAKGGLRLEERVRNVKEK